MMTKEFRILLPLFVVFVAFLANKVNYWFSRNSFRYIGDAHAPKTCLLITISRKINEVFNQITHDVVLNGIKSTLLGLRKFLILTLKCSWYLSKKRRCIAMKSFVKF